MSDNIGISNIIATFAISFIQYKGRCDGRTDWEVLASGGASGVPDFFYDICLLLNADRKASHSRNVSVMGRFLYKNDYLFPLAQLWVLQSISQFSKVVAPPLLHAVTWSASISLSL